MRLSIFLQIGFLAGTAIFLALTVYYYPIPSIAVAMLAVCALACALNAGSAVGGIASGAGCLGVIVIGHLARFTGSRGCSLDLGLDHD